MILVYKLQHCFKPLYPAVYTGIIAFIFTVYWYSSMTLVVTMGGFKGGGAPSPPWSSEGGATF